MKALVDHAIALYVPEDSAVEVKRDFAENLPLVQADKTQIATAVTNLVKNAVEAMNASGILWVSLQADDRACVFVVEDNGPGISPEIR